MGNLFADYRPALHGRPTLVDVRPLSPDRLDACAALSAEREGGDAATWRSSLERDMHQDDRLTVVGLIGDEVAGYASAGWFSPGSTRAASALPDGWYLLGVVIDPRFRRRGVGRTVTAARLEWLSARTDRAWYFVSSENRASIDLHAGFGFARVATDLDVPGVTFTGTGVLYGADLTGAARVG